MKRFSTFLILFGLICYTVGIYWIVQRDSDNNVSFNNYVQKNIPPQNQHSVSLPEHITIKSLNINLPVTPSAIKNNVWEVSTTGASYLQSSPVPGEKGNSIIYTHNWLKLFGNLVLAKPGDEIEVTYADLSKKYFYVKQIKTVTPDETSILLSGNDIRLTLFTCTGYMDSKRFVVIAGLEKPKVSQTSAVAKSI